MKHPDKTENTNTTKLSFVNGIVMVRPKDNVTIDLAAGKAITDALLTLSPEIYGSLED